MSSCFLGTEVTHPILVSKQGVSMWFSVFRSLCAFLENHVRIKNNKTSLKPIFTIINESTESVF